MKPRTTSSIELKEREKNMSTFIATELAGNRFLIEGVDEVGAPRSVILDGSAFKEILREEGAKFAGEEFDQAIADFFKPLTEASDALKEAQAPQVDPAFLYVLQEEVPSTEGTSGILLALDKDTVVLRMIHDGDYSRLIWAKQDGNDVIEILAYSQQEPQEEIPDQPTLPF